MNHAEMISSLLGKWDSLLAFLILLHSVNVLYLWVFRGIEKLDRIFLSTSVKLASSFFSVSKRYTDYCIKFSIGKVKVDGWGMKVWMAYNVLVKGTLSLFLGYYMLYVGSLKILGWING